MQQLPLFREASMEDHKVLISPEGSPRKEDKIFDKEILGLEKEREGLVLSLRDP